MKKLLQWYKTQWNRNFIRTYTLSCIPFVAVIIWGTHIYIRGGESTPEYKEKIAQQAAQAKSEKRAMEAKAEMVHEKWHADHWSVVQVKLASGDQCTLMVGMPRERVGGSNRIDLLWTYTAASFPIPCVEPNVINRGQNWEFLQIGQKCFLLGSVNSEQECPVLETTSSR